LYLFFCFPRATFCAALYICRINQCSTTDVYALSLHDALPIFAEGGMPWKYDENGTVVKESPAKETKVFDTFGEEREYVLEKSLAPDYALVRAAVGDRHGNLVFHSSARNFNPPAAQSARTTIAEVEKL